MKKNAFLSTAKLFTYLHVARKYAGLLLLTFLLCIYGFLAWRIILLTQAEPDQSAVSAQLKTVGVPKVNEDVVTKMQKLEDNSVSVQTLFDQARQNPFNE